MAVCRIPKARPQSSAVTRLLICGWLATGLGLSSACRDSPPTPPTPSSPSSTFRGDQGETVKPSDVIPPSNRVSPAFHPAEHGYVGSRACADCHAEIVASYNGTHSMARSLSAIGREPRVEDYANATFRTDGGREYHAEFVDGRLEHRERLLDPSGQTVAEQIEEIAYGVGSGRRGRTFLFQRDGMLYQSPISWYTQRRDWDLAPGYAAGNHERFDRKTTQQCFFCHAGLIEVADLACDRYGTPPVLEESIGCERCHGPGDRHVRHQNDSPAAGPDATIFNPARADPDARDAVCYQCHLRREPAFYRAGKTAFDYRPGEPYDAVWMTFVPANPRPEDLATLVEQHRSSGCFQKSDGRLGCTSCHDPHSRPAPDQYDDFYRRRCLTCHEQQGCAKPLAERTAAPRGDSCIACHMPTQPAKGIPHTALTDHRVLREPRLYPAPNAEAPTDPAGLTLFRSRQSTVNEQELRRATGLMRANLAAHTGRADLAAEAAGLFNPAGQSWGELVERYADDVPVLKHLGLIAVVGGRPEDAAAAWRQALEVEPTNESILVDLTNYYLRMREPARAAVAAERLLQVNGRLAEYHWMLSAARQGRGDLAGAAEAAEDALRRDPTAIPIRLWLVGAYENLQRPEDARRHAELLARLGVSVPGRSPPAEVHR